MYGTLNKSFIRQIGVINNRSYGNDIGIVNFLCSLTRRKRMIGIKRIDVALVDLKIALKYAFFQDFLMPRSRISIIEISSLLLSMEILLKL